MKKIKVLFVCLGNICRSPMAKFIFIDMLKNKGLEDKFIVDSAATSTEEVGNAIYYKYKQKLEKEKVKCDNHIAKQIEAEDYNKFDYIIGMEDRNVTNIIKIVGKDTEGKVSKLLDFTNNSRDIADPWYTGNFDKTYNDICIGCNAFLDFLIKND